MPDKYNFSDVFISYSRKDREFVKRIGDALASKGYEIWADWEDIPQTVDWWQEIKAGIDASNIFAFFVSPHSASSDICYQEVQHAVENNKRIVPVLCENITEDATLEKLHPAIRTHNWVSFDETLHSFGENLERLIQTMMMDIEHLRQHTRYLVRAREWESQMEDTSFVLRGRDAENASEWLRDSKEKSPAILPIQEAFILHSIERLRKDIAQENQRQTLRFIERRVLPALFISWIGLWFYALRNHPNQSLIGYDRVVLTLGVSYTPSILLAALVLIADELTAIRYYNNRLLRMGYSFVYSFALSSSVLGFLQQMFSEAKLDLITVFLGWFGLGLPVWLRSSFKLKGWQSFLISFVSMFLLINFTHTLAGQAWGGGRLPLFYFNDSSELWLAGTFVAFTVSLGCYFSPIVLDIWPYLPQNFRDKVSNILDK